ncbi:uncharacterized protein [Lolium perenne]|uniref:uncharacterized protein n=1 Tax=Lolium perenne TaxID=4522 RepID=UPI0021EA84FD|nr:uncharacterized protein LOC127347304 [Lolium perenne]
MPPPAPAPALPAEIVEEIFLRLPPGEPACLVRASLASKLWLGLLSGCSFRGRYREFHGAPPMLGLCFSWVPPFVPTTQFGVRFPGDWGSRPYIAWDSRHGRVLLQHEVDVPPSKLVVWDPMTGCTKELHEPEAPSTAILRSTAVATVLCAVTGCDHRSCHDGPFRVVFAAKYLQTGGGSVVHASLSSPETGDWSEPCSSLRLANCEATIESVPPVLLQDALYFMMGCNYDERVEILKYDLSSNCLSLHDAPLEKTNYMSDVPILMGMQDGSLGIAQLDGLTVDLWSTQMGSNGVAAWTQRAVVNLKELLLPFTAPRQTVRLVGSMEGTDIIFVIMDFVIYEINLGSLRWKKIWKQREEVVSLIPYTSFYNR